MLVEEAREKLTLEKISQNFPGGLLIYKANQTEDILFANDDLVKLFECENFEEFMKFTGGSFLYLVYHDDIEEVNEAIHSQIAVSGGNDFVYYRIITKNGNIKTIEDWGRLVDDEYFGKIYYVYLNDISEREKLFNIASTKVGRLLSPAQGHVQGQTRKAAFNMLDKLTDLATEKALQLRGANFIRRIFDAGMNANVIYFNIVNFHSYNEAYGFDGGDRILKSVARILQHTFSNSLIARVENDRFVVITSKEDLYARLVRMRARVKTIRRDARIEIQAGICKVPNNRDDFDIEALCEQAKIECESIRSNYQK